MKRKISVLAVILILIVAAGILATLFFPSGPDPYIARYEDQCATCHGEQMEGTTLGPPLVGGELHHGDTVAQLRQSIGEGFPLAGMPAWSQTLSDVEIQGLAIFVAERRVDRVFTDFKFKKPLEIPTGVVSSDLHDFRIEVALHPDYENNGWPLYSKGVDYDGNPVEYGVDLGIEFDMADIQQCAPGTGSQGAATCPCH